MEGPARPRPPPQQGPGFSLLVSEDEEISEAYDGRMVPSTFLIDEQGNLTRKLMGFKDKATLDAAFSELIES